MVLASCRKAVTAGGARNLELGGPLCAMLDEMDEFSNEDLSARQVTIGISAEASGIR